MSEDRFIEIETKLSHQEVDIEELQGIVRVQNKQIKSLEKCILKLSEQAENVNSSVASINLVDEKPPHY